MIVIAFGANLPSPDGLPPAMTCQQALAEVAALPDLRLVNTSRWWSSAPVPPSGDPNYVNGVAAFDGHVDPAKLLRSLQEIEVRFGRERTAPNAARTLDLDIIAMGDLLRTSPDPVLPHPRAHLRAFVLAPLREILPRWVHPELGRDVSSLLAEIKDQLCERV